MTHYEVLILGAGPAGLAAARRLREHGVGRVAILEREAAAGGIPRHCGHPAFGFREFARPMSGPAYARKLIDAARGAELRLRTTVTAIRPGGLVETTHPETGPATFSAKRLLVAFGVRETPRSARLVAGARPAGIFTTGALQQFVYLAGRKPCSRAVIVGSELVAFSALLTLHHAGIRPVAMLEANPRITAREPADLAAWAFWRVPVLTGTRLTAIHGLDRVEAVEIERHGHRRTIECDGVVFTGRFRPETGVLAGGHLALDPGTGGPAIDQYWRTSDSRVFAAGNLLHPVETAGRCWAEGRAAADAIAADLAGALPDPARSVPIRVASPIKYLYPQRLSLPLGEASPLLFQARVARAAKGRLRLLADGRELWSRRIAALPERRIAVSSTYLPRDGFAAAAIVLEEA
jgi:NADPH-dependent 2,4-dienoyl-CoA reductase/sulfur reductase-like enzyme